MTSKTTIALGHNEYISGRIRQIIPRIFYKRKRILKLFLSFPFCQLGATYCSIHHTCSRRRVIPGNCHKLWRIRWLTPAVRALAHIWWATANNASKSICWEIFLSLFYTAPPAQNKSMSTTQSCPYRCTHKKPQLVHQSQNKLVDVGTNWENPN